MQIVTINGESASEIGESYTLQAKKTGEFMLGPVQYGTGKTTIASNSIHILVSESKSNSIPLFSSPENTQIISLDNNQNNPLDNLITYSAIILISLLAIA